VTTPAVENPVAPPPDGLVAESESAPAATGDMVLSIPLSAKEAALVDRVARMRLGIMDRQTPVNLGEYISRLISQDLNACLKEIRTRRGG